jgi:hypothetical protein
MVEFSGFMAAFASIVGDEKSIDIYHTNNIKIKEELQSKLYN